MAPVCPRGETPSESAAWVLPDHDHLCFSSAPQLKPTGSVCREKSGDCDLEEFCTGFSASCPTDAFTQNGLTCNRGRGYCYNGQCPSRLQHCRRLWGPGKSPANVLLAFPGLGGVVTLALSGLCPCLEAAVAADACYLQHGGCRKTLFSQRCSSR